MATTFRISGATMLDGYIVDFAPRYLSIEIIAGVAYDAWNDSAYREPLRLTQDGELSDSARGGFLPDEGEIARVETKIGRPLIVHP